MRDYTHTRTRTRRQTHSLQVELKPNKNGPYISARNGKLTLNFESFVSLSLLLDPSVCHKKFNGDLFLMKHMTIYNHLPPEMRLGEGGPNDLHIQPDLEIPATAQEVIIGQEIEIDANGSHNLRVSA